MRLIKEAGMLGSDAQFVAETLVRIEEKNAVVTETLDRKVRKNFLEDCVIEIMRERTTLMCEGNNCCRVWTVHEETRSLQSFVFLWVVEKIEQATRENKS